IYRVENTGSCGYKASTAHPTSGSDVRSELPTDPRPIGRVSRSNRRGDTDFLQQIAPGVATACAQEVRACVLTQVSPTTIQPWTVPCGKAPPWPSLWSC